MSDLQCNHIVQRVDQVLEWARGKWKPEIVHLLEEAVRNAVETRGQVRMVFNTLRNCV